MTLKNKWLCLACISISFFTHIQAQVVTNIESVIQGKEIVITYDLQGQNSEAICDVTFYFGSEAEQTIKLLDAVGDFGVNIKVGTQKKIRISNLKPFLPYKTELTFKAEATYTFIPITDFTRLSGGKFKIGSTIPLSWAGGTKQSPVSISLFRNSELISSPSKLLNNNTYAFALPKAAKRGSEYEFMIEDARGIISNTGKFSLKPKMHGAVKVVISVALIGVVGGGVYMLTQNGDETPVTPPETTSMPELPDGAFPSE